MIIRLDDSPFSWDFRCSSCGKDRKRKVIYKRLGLKNYKFSCQCGFVQFVPVEVRRT